MFKRIKKNNYDTDFKVLLQAVGNGTIAKAKLNSFVYACIHRISEVVAGSNIYSYTKTNGKLKENEQSEFIKFINLTNPNNQSIVHILYLVTASLYLYGNAFVRITKNKNRLLYLEFIPSNKITVRYNSNNTFISGYDYTNGAAVEKILYNDILYFKVPNPEDNLKGKAIIDILENVIDIDYLQKQYLKNYYINDATPTTILETEKDMDANYANELEEKFVKRFKGIFNKFRPVILKNGLKMNKVQNNPEESGTNESISKIQNIILSHLSIPKVIMAITDDVNYANASAGLKTFIMNTIEPFIQLNIRPVFEKFQTMYFNESGIIQFEYPFSYDRELILKEYELFIKYNILDIDEIRERENYESIEERNKKRNIQNIDNNLKLISKVN